MNWVMFPNKSTAGLDVGHIIEGRDFLEINVTVDEKAIGWTSWFNQVGETTCSLSFPWFPLGSPPCPRPIILFLIILLWYLGRQRSAPLPTGVLPSSCSSPYIKMNCEIVVKHSLSLEIKDVHPWQRSRMSSWRIAEELQVASCTSWWPKPCSKIFQKWVSPCTSLTVTFFTYKKSFRKWQKTCFYRILGFSSSIFN